MLASTTLIYHLIYEHTKRKKIEYLGIENLGFCKHGKESAGRIATVALALIKIDKLKLSIELHPHECKGLEYYWM